MSFFSFVKSMFTGKAAPTAQFAKPSTGGFTAFVQRKITAGEVAVDSVMTPLAERMLPEPSAFGKAAVPTEEQMAKAFAESEVDAFLHFGQWMKVESSNVDEIHYDGEQSQLTIRYKNGGIYIYQNVSIREAESFAKAMSKGRWIWSSLRVRGKGNFWAYRKPYQFLSGLSNYQPQWMRKQSVRLLHGRVGPEGLKNPKWAKVLMPRNTKK